MEFIETIKRDLVKLKSLYEAEGLKPDLITYKSVVDHSNMNHVLCITDGKKVLYAKSAPTLPLGGGLSVTASRNQYEAKAMLNAQSLNTKVGVPKVIHINYDHHYFIMRSLSSSANLLSNRNLHDLTLLSKHANALAAWLVAFHQSELALERPVEQTQLMKNILFNHIYSVGMKAVFPNQWEASIRNCFVHRNEMVHSDFWGKNLLVDDEQGMNVLDFEGAMFGDGALDITSLLCTGLFCIGMHQAAVEDWRQFAHNVLKQYVYTATNVQQAKSAVARVVLYLPILIVHRTSGSFPYELSNKVKQSLIAIAKNISSNGFKSTEECVDAVAQSYCEAISQSEPEFS